MRDNISRLAKGPMWVGGLLVAGVVLACTSLPLMAGTDPLCSAFEPNDSFQAAVPITNGLQVNAAICPAGDLDFYAFSLTSPASLSLALQTAQNFQGTGGSDTGGSNTPTGSGDQPLSLELYDGSSNLVATGSVSGGDLITISYAAQAGSYYAKVFDPLALDEEGYTLVASWSQSANDVPLTVLAEPQGAGSVTVNPAGQSFAAGTVVTLTAVPASGSTFGFWSGVSGITPNANPITFTLQGPAVVEAHFDSGASDFQAVASLQGIPAAAVLSSPASLTVASASSALPVASVSYFVDGAAAASSTTAPFAWTLQPGSFGNGPHMLNVFLRTSPSGVTASKAVPFSVETATAPAITSVKALKNPYRLKVTGTGFVSGSKVTINGTAAPHSRYKAKKGAMIAGSGTAMTHLLPKKTSVCVRVSNPDGTASACFSFTRP